MVAWMGFSSPYAAELMGHLGFDAVTIDLQHGPLFIDAAIPMLQAISATPAMPMVRCSGNNFSEIGKLLDAGAYAVICPLVDSAEDARRFVSACRYPPMGTRSSGPARALLYGGPDYFDHANQTVLTWAMIETAQGIEQLDEICAVEGLDGVFVGPSDLSIALGLRPQVRWTEPPLRPALERIVAAAHRHGRMAGIFCTTAEMARDMRLLGYDMLVLANDAVMLRSAADQWLKIARS